MGFNIKLAESIFSCKKRRELLSSRESVFEENFGVLEIDWTDQGPIVDASIRNVEGNILLKKRVLNPSLKKN